MSVLKQVAASPGRIVAVYRYLLQVDGQSEMRDRLEAVLSPTPLRGAKSDLDMVHKAVNECVKMGLLAEEGGRVRLHPDLPPAARDRHNGSARIPVTLTDLLLRVDGENEDFALILAWYLDQDVRSAPGEWEAFSLAVDRQVGGDRLGLTNNDNPYNQFDDWACFLGFAWRQAHGKSFRLTPDPTQYLRWRLPEVFGRPGTRLAAAPLADRLAQVCPVFEGGGFRREVDRRTGRRRERELSSVTAHA
ncbi:MAG TPA: protein DpdG, partial [Longimicrobiaceae bacterium]|nr:protein DpdG [Longimicrobiaceae bacterium]